MFSGAVSGSRPAPFCNKLDAKAPDVSLGYRMRAIVELGITARQQFPRRSNLSRSEKTGAGENRKLATQRNQWRRPGSIGSPDTLRHN